MSRGPSGRVVIEIEPDLKNRLHAALALEGRTLKDWFLEQLAEYLNAPLDSENMKLGTERRWLEERTRGRGWVDLNRIPAKKVDDQDGDGSKNE